MKENFKVDYVDLITEPGMDKVLSEGPWIEVERIRDNLEISINAHDSHQVAVVGHFDCAANPVTICKHIQDIVKSTDTVKSWGFPIVVVGLWVDEFSCVHLVTK